MGINKQSRIIDVAQKIIWHYHSSTFSVLKSPSQRKTKNQHKEVWGNISYFAIFFYP